MQEFSNTKWELPEDIAEFKMDLDSGHEKMTKFMLLAIVEEIIELKQKVITLEKQPHLRTSCNQIKN